MLHVWKIDKSSVSYHFQAEYILYAETSLLFRILTAKKVHKLQDVLNDWSEKFWGQKETRQIISLHYISRKLVIYHLTQAFYDSEI